MKRVFHIVYNVHLGPPVHLYRFFFGEGSLTKIDHRKKELVPTYSKLSTGGPEAWSEVA